MPEINVAAARHKQRHAKGGPDALTPTDIGALPDTYTPPTATWAGITGKPATFPASAHVHPTAEVTGLSDALDGKAAADHTHTPAQVGALPADDPRVRDTGWRVISSWGTDGTVTGTALAAGWVPRAGQAGGIWVRRVGLDVHVRFANVACATANTNNPPSLALGLVIANPATAVVPGVVASSSGVSRFHPMGPRGERRSGASLAAGDYFADLTVTGLAATEAWPTTLPGTPA